MTVVDELAARLPQPRKAGAEMVALVRFYFDTAWTGTIEPGGMGPGSPAMTATGHGVHRRIQDGLWIVGDYQQDQFLPDGTFMLRWKLHWVTGWDAEACEYRATMNDNYGHAEVMRGYIDGDRLVYESMGEPLVRLRVTWDLSDRGAPTWTNEASTAHGDWHLVERYRMDPTEGSRL
jgi:hypothetical protein